MSFVDATDISITLQVEKDHDLSNDKRIRIIPTKKESFFAPFQHKDSISYKISMGIAEDPLLLKFLFLKSTNTTSFYGSRGTIITFPLILEPTYDFKGNLEDREDYKRRNESLEKILERNTNEIKEAWGNMTKEFLSIMIEQPKIQQLLKSRSPRSLEELTREMTKVTKENDDMIEHAKGNIKTLGRYTYEAQILLKLKEFVELSNDARQNCMSLNSYLKLPDNKEQICSSIATLAKYTDFSIEAVCLDCWYEHRQLPFTFEMSRATKIDLSSNCQTCSGMGIIHKISFGFPSEVNSLLLEDSSWLYEVFIGHAIASYDFIKKVYVHKKIQPYDKDGKVQKGMEADIIAITNDDKLVIIEVTKQQDKSNIHENIETKIKNLQEYGIPYHKLIYVTASNADNFYDISNHNTRIFALKHLTNLEGFIREFVMNNK